MMCSRMVPTSAMSLRRSLSTSSVLPAINHEFHKVIQWNPPGFKKPWDPQRSCDLRPLAKINPNWLKVEYRPFAELIDKLPESHRKIFTVGYGARRDAINVIMQNAIDKVKRHKYDRESLETKISWLTVKIRSYQHLFETQPLQQKSGYHRNNVKELIDKRRKWLGRLKAEDYKRFEWLLEVLSVLYKPNPTHTRIERKASLNVLVNMFCNEIREKKMAEYKAQLESEKIPFLEMKLLTLEKLKEDEESVNLECSVSKEIEDTKNLLQKLTKSHLTIHPVGTSLPENENTSVI